MRDRAQARARARKHPASDRGTPPTAPRSRAGARRHVSTKRSTDPVCGLTARAHTRHDCQRQHVSPAAGKTARNISRGRDASRRSLAARHAVCPSPRCGRIDTPRPERHYLFRERPSHAGHVYTKGRRSPCCSIRFCMCRTRHQTACHACAADLSGRCPAQPGRL